MGDRTLIVAASKLSVDDASTELKSRVNTVLNGDCSKNRNTLGRRKIFILRQRSLILIVDQKSCVSSKQN